MAEKFQIEAEISARDSASPELAKAGRGFDALGSVMDRFVVTAGDVVNVLGSVRGVVADLATEQRVLAVFREQLKAAGEDFETFTEQTRAATAGTVSDLEAVSRAAQAIALEIDPKLLPQLFETARIQAAAFGITTTEALGSITKGLGRLSPLRLDDIGLTIDAERAYKEYAKQIGAAADSLTEFEKRQALAVQIIEQGRISAETYGTALGGIGVSIDRVNTFLENQKKQLITGVVNWINNSDAVKALNLQIEEWLGNAPVVEDRIGDISEAAASQKQFMDELIGAWAELSTVQKAIDQDTKELLGTIEDLGVTTIPEAEANIEKLRQKFVDLDDIERAGIITKRQYQQSVADLNIELEANEAVLRGDAVSVKEYKDALDEARRAADDLTGATQGLNDELRGLGSDKLPEVRRQLLLTAAEFDRLSDKIGRTAAVAEAVEAGGEGVLFQGGTRVRVRGGSRLVRPASSGDESRFFSNLTTII